MLNIVGVIGLGLVILAVMNASPIIGLCGVVVMAVLLQ